MPVFRLPSLFLALVLAVSPLALAEEKPVPPANDPLPEPEVQVEQSDPDNPECRVRMEFGTLAFQDVSIKGKRIKGPDFSLEQDGDVTYGFVMSKPTRFRTQEDRISGSIAEMDLMLNIEHKGITTKVFGLVGTRRVVVKISADKVTVYAAGSSYITTSANMVLTRSRGNRLTGHVGLGADMSSASMVTFGCDLSTIRERPELIVVLFMWWLGV